MSYVAVGDEDHVRDGAAGEDAAADELADEEEAALLVGDGHDDSNGDEEDSTHAEGYQKPIPWKVDRVAIYPESLAIK